MTRPNLEVRGKNRKPIKCTSLCAFMCMKCYFIDQSHVLITEQYTVAQTAILTGKNSFTSVVFNYLATLPEEEGTISDNHMMLSLKHAVP